MSEPGIIAAEFIVPGTNKTRFVCELCSVSFVLLGNLNRHLRRFHQMQVELQGTLICALCDEKFRTMALLHEHIQNQHSIALKFVEETFYSEKDFKDWKYKMEEETRASYVCRKTTANKSNGSTSSFYSCHRSGHYKSKQNRVRKMKASGSIKTGCTCPAFIKVSTQTVDGISEIKVKHQSVHLGHELETRTLRFTKKERENLAACLKLGIPMDKLLDEARQNCSPTNRYSLLTRKYLHNIRGTYGIELISNKTRQREAPHSEKLPLHPKKLPPHPEKLPPHPEKLPLHPEKLPLHPKKLPSTVVESSDSSIGYEEYHETEEIDHQEEQELEKSTATSLLLVQQESHDSDEFNNRKRKIVDQLNEVKSRIEKWDRECSLPDVEEYIKTLNARLDIAACAKKNFICLTKDSEPVPPKKPSPKRRKITKKVSKKNHSKDVPLSSFQCEGAWLEKTEFVNETTLNARQTVNSRTGVIAWQQPGFYKML